MTVVITLFLLVILVFLFLYFKKGTPLYEIFHLPEYWWQVLPVKIDQMLQRKIAYGEHQRQYFWLLQPFSEQPKTNKVIIWFHGGGWRHGRAEMFKANGQVLVNEGHIVILASYRLAPRFNYFAMREDLNLLLPKILQIIDYQLDKHKIIIGGMSAGATLAALLLYDRTTLAQLKLEQNIFSGGLFFGAPLDLNGMPDNYILRSYAGRKNSPQFIQANPISYLNEREQTPILIVQGTRDGLVNHHQVYAFLKKIRAVQTTAIDVHWIENGSHLDSVRWTYRDDEVRKILLHWLKKI